MKKIVTATAKTVEGRLLPESVVFKGRAALEVTSENGLVKPFSLFLTLPLRSCGACLGARK